MCTVTLARAGGGWRLVHNRDEQRRRAPGSGVRLHDGGRLALWPVDGAAGGTWIGVNQRGLFGCVLNRNPDPPWRPAEPRSRGLLLPPLLVDCDDLDAAHQHLARLDPLAYAPFRLLLGDDHGAAHWCWDGTAFVREEVGEGALLLTSSGLGDHLVEARRRQLFGQRAEEIAHNPAAQDAFHRHSWPDDGPTSVCMRRHDACTVSSTRLVTTPASVVCAVHQGPPDRPAPVSAASLPRRGR